MPLKTLLYCDAPTASTGFGTVSRNIFTPLIEDGTVDANVIGVNYFGHPHSLPFKIWPAQVGGDQDPYGRGRAVYTMLHDPNYRDVDLFFFLQDHFTLAQDVVWPDNVRRPFLPALVDALDEQRKAGHRKDYRVVQYVPIDSETLYPEWIAHLAKIEYPVAYTRFGRRVMASMIPPIEPRLRQIPHGTNPETFFPIPTEERRRVRQELFGCSDNQPIVLNVNRNQPRKDIPRTMQIFRRVLREYPNAKLYLHMNPFDPMGFALEPIQQNLRIPRANIMYAPDIAPGFSEGVGIPWEKLNLIYNAADVMVTTVRGGGWELPVTEAMCAGCPTVAPAHTSLIELMEDGRGLLVEPEEELQTMAWDNNILRPVADVPAMADAVVRLLGDQKLRDGMREKAYRWARQLGWREHVVPQWRDLFLGRASQQVEQGRSQGLTIN